MIKKQIVDAKRTDLIGARGFFRKLEDLVKDGWTVVEGNTFREAPRFYPYPVVFLEKEVEDEIVEVKHELVSPAKEVISESELKVPEDLVEDSLKGISTKEELKAFADERNIPIPEHLKQPSAIKKYLREQVEDKSAE